MQNLLENFEHDALNEFLPLLCNQQFHCCERPQSTLPAASYIDEPGIALSPQGFRPFLKTFNQNSPGLNWEQTYTKADKAIGKDMLDGYGFAEIVGPAGPFVSQQIRTGVGVWAPQVNYPKHHHKAEEIYLILSGGASFGIGDEPYQYCNAGQLIHVKSLQRHGFFTTQSPLIVLYLWRNGDLREKSTF
ncbi:MAG: mannose-6-phosphate isomerase-like protein (cupin superfamily) [Parasphingorhabdus sp.]|jgi:mannose-6-phosphate isomerase-like protein (cupin superfamily)